MRHFQRPDGIKTIDEKIQEKTGKKNSIKFHKQSKHNQKTPLTVDGFDGYVKDKVIDEATNKSKTTIGHAVGPITSRTNQIRSSFLNSDAEYDEDTIENWIPHMSLSVVDSESGSPLTAAEVNTRRNDDKWIPQFFVNPMQDLDYIVIEALARNTFMGPLMDALTKFIVGTGFKPELELINPSNDPDKDKNEMEENQDVIDTLLGIDAQLEQDDENYIDISFTEKITSLIGITNLFNRGALIFGYDKPIKVNGKIYKQIPSSMKFAHSRDLGITEVDPRTWRIKSVQWRNAFYQVPARDMIYSWNPIVSAKTRNSWGYGDSMAMPFIDASRVIRKNIGVNFPAMAEATWAGMYILGIRPNGKSKSDKQAEYQQIADNMVRGGPNIILEDPENWKSETVDFAPKVTEFKDLTEFLLRYSVASLGLPQSMFFDESQSNRATMIGKIQLATSTVINPMRNIFGRGYVSQWYGRWYRLIYKESKPDIFKKFRIKLAFNDLRIEEWFDKIEAVNELDSRKQLKDEYYGELAGIENYQGKVEEDAETKPGGAGGKGIEFKDGSKLNLKEPKEQLKSKTEKKN